MLLKIYDMQHNYIGLVDKYRDISTTEILSTGLKSLSFQAPCLESYYSMLQEENYIKTFDYDYVIKEVVYDGNDFFTVYAVADVEAITGVTFMNFDCFEKALEDAYAYCLSRSEGWTLRYTSTERTQVTYQEPNVTAMDMIYKIAKDYQQELRFDSKNKILYVYAKRGKLFGSYYSDELRLKSLKQQSSTYDFATVLYPIGKNGLTIETVNNGRPFIDNYTYSDKYVEKIWVNEDYDVAEKLLAAAEIHLNEICQPKASYKLQLTDLGDTVQVGDTVLLIDKLKRIKQKQRVVKIVRFPEAPEKSQIELSNLQEDFARNFVKQQKRIEKQIAYIKSVIANLT